MSEYCGCCGRPCRGDWCDDCLAHLRPPQDRGAYAYTPAHQRTYFAQYHRSCPFDVLRPNAKLVQP